MPVLCPRTPLSSMTNVRPRGRSTPPLGARRSLSAAASAMTPGAASVEGDLAQLRPLQHGVEDWREPVRAGPPGPPRDQILADFDQQPGEAAPGHFFVKRVAIERTVIGSLSPTANPACASAPISGAARRGSMSHRMPTSHGAALPAPARREGVDGEHDRQRPRRDHRLDRLRNRAAIGAPISSRRRSISSAPTPALPGTMAPSESCMISVGSSAPRFSRSAGANSATAPRARRAGAASAAGHGGGADVVGDMAASSACGRPSDA